MTCQMSPELKQGLETALLTRLQLGECTHSYNQPVLNQVITFSWEERVVLKFAEKQHTVGERKNGTQKEERAAGK